MKIYLGLAVIACLLTGCTVDNPSVPVLPESEEQDDPGERGGAETFDVNVECWKYLNKKWVKDKVSLKFEVTDTKNYEVGLKQMQGTGGNYVQVDIPEKVKYNKRDYKVTSILPRAFKKCKELDGIFIPASVRKIGVEAFLDCYSMTSVKFEFGAYLHTIGADAFRDCTTLQGIDIPGSVEVVQGFKGCTGLKEVTINGSREIGEEAFENCINLETLILNDGTRYIRSGAFRYCGMTTVEIPSSVWEINIWAFDCCYDLTKAIIHGSPTIFSGAFPNNTELVYAE